MTDSRIQELFDEVETSRRFRTPGMPWLLPGRSWTRNWIPGTTMNSIPRTERKETGNGGRRAAPSASGLPAKIGRDAYDG